MPDESPLNHDPEVAMELVSALFYGPKRSSRVVKHVMDSLHVSEPTVYGALHELVARKIIEKQEKSRRRVIYKLTDEGRKLLETEHFSAIDKMLENVKNDDRRREIMVELLLQDLVKELPPEVRDSVSTEALRNTAAEEVEDLRKRLVRIASALLM